MIVRLREVEPFNFPPVDNQEAALFMRHLTGNETFEFDGDQKPKSMLIYDLIYKYPRLCSAHGWLLSVDIDTFENMCDSGKFNTMEPILKATIIGTIGIDLGGNLTYPSMYASKVKL